MLFYYNVKNDNKKERNYVGQIHRQLSTQRGEIVWIMVWIDYSSTMPSRISPAFSFYSESDRIAVQ